MTLPRNKETAKIKRTANWIRLPSPNVLSLVRGRLFMSKIEGSSTLYDENTLQ